jgi:drug/metabolite transporter (DMT)-like permease
MPTAALLLVGLGALAHTGWNLAAKRASGSGVAFIWLSSVIAMLVVTPFAAGSLSGDRPAIRVLLLGGVVSGIIHVIYFVLLLQAYRVGDVSLAYPMARGSGPLIAMIGSLVIFAERPAVIALAGGLVVICGVAVIGFAGTRGVQVQPGVVGFGLATGVAIAAYTLWDSYSVNQLAISPMAQSWMSSATETVLLLPVVLASRIPIPRLVSRDLRAAMIVGIGSPLAYIAIMYAMRSAPTALVAPGREVSVVLVSLAGWLIFKEPNPRPRLLGAAVVLAGILGLALG